jgi:nitrate reductase NapE
VAELSPSAKSDASEETFSKRREWGLFLFLTVVLAPVLAVGFVGGYGFLVWMYQLIAGPPGAPPA